MSKRKRPPLEPSVDRREVPAYSLPEAARYLRMPVATLRFFQPVIRLPQEGWPVLSFVNLVEAHVLDAIRRDHEISLRKVRTAVAFLRRHYGSIHPLADHQFETDGLDLFIGRAGLLINLTQAGQLAMRQLVHAYLKRIERDPAGAPLRLYPFTRKRALEEPRSVVIDPFVSFGRPVLTGTGISTAIVAERFKAGEALEELARDYERSLLEIQEAIRCELPLEAA
jgi:uncharacterized protein (DUF433 family)